MASVIGTNFQPGAQVLFDGQPASSVVWQSPTLITCSPPAHAAGLVDVKVVNPDGTSATAVGVYTYGLFTNPPAGYSAWLKTSSLANGAVSSWLATGTAPPTMVQPTGANQPVKSSGPSVVTYDGVNDILTDQTIDTFTSTFTVGIKFKLASLPTGIGDFQTLLELRKSSGTNGMLIAFVPGATGYGPITVSGSAPNTGSVYASPTLDTSAAHRLIVTYSGGANSAPGSYQMLYDGVSQSLTAGSTLVAVTKNVLGALDNAGTPANWFHGLHYDVVVYPTILSSGDLTNLDGFLQALA